MRTPRDMFEAHYPTPAGPGLRMIALAIIDLADAIRETRTSTIVQVAPDIPAWRTPTFPVWCTTHGGDLCDRRPATAPCQCNGTDPECKA